MFVCICMYVCMSIYVYINIYNKHVLLGSMFMAYSHIIISNTTCTVLLLIHNLTSITNSIGTICPDLLTSRMPITHSIKYKIVTRKFLLMFTSSH